MADSLETQKSQNKNNNEALINFDNYYSIFRHANKNCMSFSQHAILSLTFSGKLFLGSVKALIHAFIPDVYSKSTTDLIQEIEDMIKVAGCHNPDLEKKEV